MVRFMENRTDLWKIEREYAANGKSLICGVDEAGRGPLAGAVFAAAVILPHGVEIEGLDDSKKLSEKKREALFDVICEKALAFGIASSSEKEIDEINILNASLLAMKRAVRKLSVSPDMILVDGNKVFETETDIESVVKGDGLSASIAAASILAKVSRDRYMSELAEKYPEYCFEKHKGYPTKLHYECVEKYGLSDIHRRSFFKKYKGGVLVE
ncbi:MAG: ribonuclease HII [Oscillospiraceae bacterium]|nr:ribonuclease HII [Oscillospiraceae bacterium]